MSHDHLNHSPESKPEPVSRPQPAAPVIEMQDATAMSLRQPDRPALQHIDWKVLSGQFWAIGGLHGSGKTDFMTLAAGIIPPGQGVCRLFGHDLSKTSEREQTLQRLRLGKVFDGGQLLHDLNLAENIALPIAYHRNQTMADCRERVGQLLEFTQLTPLARKLPGEISRHWRQRAGLARALALQPELLLLDSPLSGMDPRHGQWWLQRLEELARGHRLVGGERLTIVITGNDLRPWQGVASKFAVLKDGHFLTSPDNVGHATHSEKLWKELIGSE